MAIDFENLTPGEVRRWIDPHDDYEVNASLFEGDHWLDAIAWKDFLPDQSKEPQVYQKSFNRIKSLFTSQNLVREVVTRHVSGTMGSEPRLSFARTHASEEDDPDEDEELERYNETLRGYFDERNLQGKLQELIQQMLLGERAYLRAWIPPEKFEEDEDGNPRGLPSMSFEEALDIIYVDVVTCEQGVIYTDIASMQQVSVFEYELNNQTYYELSWTDEDGMTHLARIGSTAMGPEAGQPIDLGGELMMHEVSRELFITPQVRQQQHLANRNLTIMGANLNRSGFLERIFLNAQQPKEIKEDPETGEIIEEPVPYEAGMGKVLYLSGLTYQTAEGNTRIAQPDVVFREPIQADVFRDTLGITYQAILRETRQLHAELSDDAALSGQSRLQARADYRDSLQPTKTEIDAAGRWAMMVPFQLAAEISGEPLPDDLRADFACRLDLGPIPPDELRVITERVEKGQLSLRTALSIAGVGDVEAEIERIRTSDSAEMARSAKMADIIQILTAAGADLRSAARTAGFDDEQIEVLASVAGPPPVAP